MALLICGGKEKFEHAPTIVHYSEPISPLTYYDPAIDKILFSVENGIPLINLSAPQLGATAPASFAGTIVQGCAESLSGLVLAQVVRPGVPFIFGSQTTIMDMKTSIFSYGATEMSLTISAMAEIIFRKTIPPKILKQFGTRTCSTGAYMMSGRLRAPKSLKSASGKKRWPPWRMNQPLLNRLSSKSWTRCKIIGSRSKG